jgi:parvulin-like peptidyl-prolyl isomerase
MAMMAKMRSLAPAFIISVGVLFVLFMVLSDSNVTEVLGLRSNYVGSINGEKVSYQEFLKAEQQEKENIKQQTGKDVADENTDKFRDQVWNALVTQKLISEQINKYGIEVPDQEVKDIILNHPPQFLKRNFIDSTGKFDRQLYLNALYDKRNAQALLQAEDYVRQNKLSEKLQSMLFASINVSNAEIRRQFIDQTTKINTRYALVDLNTIPNKDVSVSDNELKQYYNAHLDDYKVPAKRKLKYVLFRNTPSKEDSSTVRRELENVLDEIKNSDTTSFESMAKSFSSIPYAKDTLSLSTFPEEAANKLYKGKPDQIYGPIASHEGYVLYHFLESVNSKTTEVRASHILINQYGSDDKNLAEAMKIYNELKGGADFAKLAEENSKDPGSAVKGGDLGWFGRGRMVPEFEKAAFAGRIGEILKPVKTNYGYHIIKVTGRTDKKYVVAKIVDPVKPSITTKENNINEAKDFSYIANKDGFEKEAKMMKYKFQETPDFTKNSYAIPGIGVSKELIDFAFDNSKGTIGEAMRVPPGFVVAMVSGETSENIQTFEKVKAEIKPILIKQKKYEKAKQISEKIKSNIGGDLTKAKTVYPAVTVNTTGEFTPSGSVPTVGMDFSFISKALDLKPNTVSKPFKGQKGYYLIKVLSRTPFDSSAYAVQKNTIRQRLLQQQKNQYFSQWITQLRKNSDIVDHRRQFFGL